MFNRIAYKEIARRQLYGRWTTPVIATVIVYVISIVAGASVPVVGVCASALLIIAYSYLFAVLSHTKDKQSLSVFMQGFSLWLDGLLGFFWFMLWTVFWTCLFIIPGIVKMYSYRQMFFIIAEARDIDVRKAMNLSKKISRGHRMSLFLMDLSFLGWLFLTVLTGGILGLWVIPYITMTNVNAFHSMKKQALDAGLVKEDDFNTSEEDNHEKQMIYLENLMNTNTNNEEGTY